MDACHTARLAKQFKWLDDSSQINKWDVVKYLNGFQKLLLYDQLCRKNYDELN